MPSSRFPVIRGPDSQQSRVQDNVQAVLGPVAQALQATPIMGAAPPPWIAPALLNGFAAVTAGFAPPSFQIDALGYVHFRGGVSNAAGCAASTAIFLLPLNARPRFAHLFASTDGTVIRAFTVTAAGLVSTETALAAGGALTLECVFQVGG